jgi:hypothetical protein
MVNERQVNNGSSFNVKTRWTISYRPDIQVGQHLFNARAPSKVYIGAFMDDQE